MNTKVYLSGGHRSGWRDPIKSRFPYLVFFDPSKTGIENATEYTRWDLEAIDNSDIVFAFMERTNPVGIGLVAEIGYSVGKGKRVILVDEKSSTDDSYARSFAIVREMSSVVFDDINSGVDELERICLEMAIGGEK